MLTFANLWIAFVSSSILYPKHGTGTRGSLIYYQKIAQESIKDRVSLRCGVVDKIVLTKDYYYYPED